MDDAPMTLLEMHPEYAKRRAYVLNAITNYDSLAAENAELRAFVERVGALPLEGVPPENTAFNTLILDAKFLVMRMRLPRSLSPEESDGT